MKKRISREKLGGKKSRSDMILKNMLLSLMMNGKFETTSARAKVFKQYANKELSYSLSVEGGSIKNRIVGRVTSDKCADLLLLYREFRGGSVPTGDSFILSMKTRYRDGDNAEMTEVTLIDRDAFLKFVESKKPKAKKKKKSTPAKSKSKKEDSKAKKETENVDKEKKVEEKEKKDTSQDVKPKDSGKAPPKKKEGFFDQLSGRILGRKVSGPEGAGKKGRSTARSGI